MSINSFIPRIPKSSTTKQPNSPLGCFFCTIYAAILRFAAFLHRIYIIRYILCIKLPPQNPPFWVEVLLKIHK